MGVRAERVLKGTVDETDAGAGEGDLGGDLEGWFGSVDLLGSLSHGDGYLVFLNGGERIGRQEPQVTDFHIRTPSLLTVLLMNNPAEYQPWYSDPANAHPYTLHRTIKVG